MQICGGVLAFDHETSEIVVEAIQKFESLSRMEKREFAEANGHDFDEAFSDLSPTERLRAIAPLFTTFWLVRAIGRIQAPAPERRG